MAKRGQGAIEYLLLLGGIILVVIVAVGIIRLGITAPANQQVAGSLSVLQNVTNASSALEAEMATPTPTVDITPPNSNSPPDASYALGSSGNTIPWVLTDENATGYYRVLKNGTAAVDWTTWANNTNLAAPVNASALGQWNYTIEFNDSNGNFGAPDTVLVDIVDLAPPQSNSPADGYYDLGSAGNTIPWVLTDDVGPGSYSVLRNGTTVAGWTAWANSTNLAVPVNTTASGAWNYTIYYNDSSGNLGIPDTVTVFVLANVTITTCGQSYSAPGYYNLSSNLSCSPNGVNFTPGASGSRFNCRGFTLIGSNYAGYGIFLDGVSNFTIYNCSATRYEKGVYSAASDNITVIYSGYYNNSYGMHLSATNNSAILFDYFNSNTNYGLLMNPSKNNTITGNTAVRNRYRGFDLIYTTNTAITNNTIQNHSEYGIMLENNSNNNVITNNTIYNATSGGIVMYNYSSSNIVANNTGRVGGNMVSAQLLSNNNTIANNTMNGSWTGVYISNAQDNVIYGNTARFSNQSGILMDSGSRNNTVYSNTFTNSTAGHGVYLYSSPNNSIHDNNLRYNYWYNVVLQLSSSNTVANNIADNATNGPDLFIVDSANNTVVNNTFEWTKNSHGVVIRNSTWTLFANNSVRFSRYDNIDLENSTNNTVSGNNATEAVAVGNYGIILYGSDGNIVYGNNASYNRDSTGVFLYYSDNNTIRSNVAAFNGYAGQLVYGILLFWSNNNTISQNLVFNNSAKGIWLNGSSFNTLSSNNVSFHGAVSWPGPGMHLTYSPNNTITGNAVMYNGRITYSTYGLLLEDGSSDCAITSNTVDYNYGNGLWVDSGLTGIVVWGNSASYNGNQGLTMSSSGNNVTSNVANGNRLYGIQVGSGDTGNVIADNVACGNYWPYWPPYDIWVYAAQSTASGGNTCGSNRCYQSGGAWHVCTPDTSGARNCTNFC